MIEPGALLQNRYRIVKQIGEGGMGVVYIATDERFHSTVAIKQTFFDDPTLRKAFEREAHLLNHLRHVALPRVSDHFVEGEGQFLVMEFIEGDELAESLQRRGAFPLADVLRWADELLDALEYLHTHEPPIVHRDIKPQNMKLTSRGQIVLLDFGLAKGAATGTPASATASVFGYSRSYAPLEQIQGTGTDTRSDLYSLGATLYHLLTGVAPVDGLTRASAMINQQPDPLRPAHLVHAQVPEPVSKILHRAMALKAALRPATAAEMRAALRQASAGIARTKPHVAAPRTLGHSARNEATMVDGGTQIFDGQQATPSTLSQTRLRAASSLTESEATIVDSPLDRTQTSIKSYSHTSFQEPPTQSEHKNSKAMIVGVALAVLIACAFVAFPLLQSPAQSPTNSQTQNESQPAGSQEAQPLVPDTTQTEATRQTSDSTSAAGRALSPELRTTGETRTPSGETPSSEAEASRNSAVNSDGSKGFSPAVEASDNKSGLVIQSPVPVSTGGVKNEAAAEYDAQRAEDLRRRKEQQALELQQQRQREQFRPPPPPHGGGYPPPGGGHRPPPHRPPPMR